MNSQNAPKATPYISSMSRPLDCIAEDIAKLLPLFHRLVAKGHTVLIIEHNLDVIASADYLLDLGPDSGADGGTLVAEGTPEQIAAHPSSYTGHYLKKFLVDRQ